MHRSRQGRDDCPVARAEGAPATCRHVARGLREEGNVSRADWFVQIAPFSFLANARVIGGPYS